MRKMLLIVDLFTPSAPISDAQLSWLAMSICRDTFWYPVVIPYWAALDLGTYWLYPKADAVLIGSETHLLGVDRAAHTIGEFRDSVPITWVQYGEPPVDERPHREVNVTRLPATSAHKRILNFGDCPPDVEDVFTATIAALVSDQSAVH